MTDVPPVPPPSDDGFDSLSDLLDAVHAFITRYVVLTHHAAIACTLWAVHTWIYLEFDATPRLRISSPEEESGKSRLVEVLDRLVCEPLRASSVSAASLFRGIEELHPTIMLDEADLFFAGADKGDKSDVLALINDGYRADGRVLRVAGEGKNMKVRRFSVFAPVLIAGLSKVKLPKTTTSRTIPIDMRRKKAGENAERLRLRDGHEAAKPIRAALEVWSGSDQAKDLGDARPDLPDDLSDRQQDIWEPLLAIADAAGGDWPTVARQAAVHLHTKSPSARRARDSSLGVRLLRDIRRVWPEHNGKPAALFNTGDMLFALNGMDAAPWSTIGKEDKPLNSRFLGILLAEYGIKPKALAGWPAHTGLPYSDGTRGFKREPFQDAWDRYLTDSDDDDDETAPPPPDDPLNPQGPQESHGQAVSDDSQPARHTDSLWVGKTPKPRGQAILADLAGQNGHQGTRGECAAPECHAPSRRACRTCLDHASLERKLRTP